MTIEIEQEDPMLTHAEAAKRLHVSSQTLYFWRSQEFGPNYKRVRPGRRGKVLYPLSEIVKWQKSIPLVVHTPQGASA